MLMVVPYSHIAYQLKPWQFYFLTQLGCKYEALSLRNLAIDVSESMGRAKCLIHAKLS